MTPRIQRAIDIFLDALNNNTLAAGTCKACACGNLVAASMNLEVQIPKTEKDDYKLSGNELWASATDPISTSGGPYYNPAEGLTQIESTGFTVKEFSIIEKAFEENTLLTYPDYPETSKEEIRRDQICGLKAVVKVMMAFEECEDSVQEVFTSKAELIPV